MSSPVNTKYAGIEHVRAEEDKHLDPHYSSIAIDNPDSLRVVGAVPHNTEFAPRDAKEAVKLMAWLSEWLEKHCEMGLGECNKCNGHSWFADTHQVAIVCADCGCLAP